MRRPCAHDSRRGHVARIYLRPANHMPDFTPPPHLERQDRISPLIARPPDTDIYVARVDEHDGSRELRPTQAELEPWRSGSAIHPPRSPLVRTHHHATVMTELLAFSAFPLQVSITFNWNSNVPFVADGLNGWSLPQYVSPPA
jgi:hypothetical protein